MQIKKIITLAMIQVIVLAVAAFGSGGLKDLFNTQIKAAEAAGSGNELPSLVVVSGVAGDSNGQTVSIINILPAPELPTRAPDAAGAFGGFDGSRLTLQQTFFVTTTVSEGAVVGSSFIITGTSAMELAPGGPMQGSLVIVSSGIEGVAPITGTVEFTPVEAGSISLVGPGMPGQTNPQVVVVTDKTLIYRDVTSMVFPSSGGTQTIQQVLETGSLEGLNGTVMVTVWGHMEGDVLVADVILYQLPVEVK